ncbi:DNA methyltransferase [Inquilinus sp.]|uniref:DNA methyltransferase n=1 Tax=Inquilinus sp. TaxID=1932117 RepID=UPI0031D771FF
MNRLYFGDNLEVLREHIKDETVDLVYLDPPFNSNATYNLLFKSASGRRADAQIEAFDDTWHWGEAAAGAFHDVVRRGDEIAGMLRAFRGFLGENDMMAYLAMMAARLTEMRRVMKPTASLFLHCDPTASHYLKIMLDGIFGTEFFTNEIVWKRTTPKGLAFTRFPSNHDLILFYRRSEKYVWSMPFSSHDASYIKSHYNLVDKDTGRHFQATSLLNPNPNRPNLTYEFAGHRKVWRWTKERMQKAAEEGKIYFPPGGGVPREKRFLDEQRGTPITSVWTDIPPVNSQADERIGYPTQKPLALLGRIIEASTNPGAVVLDPFCGCGTAIHAAERLGRAWIGIDVTHLAIEVIESRIAKFLPSTQYTVIGRPLDLEGAAELARRDKHQFQLWAVWLAQGTPYQDGKKGRDRGIDGQRFFPAEDGEAERAIISVKGGDHLSPAMVRDLRGTIEREGAACGLLILLRPPTREMEREAAAAGMTDLPGRPVPRVQIRTVAQLLDRNGFDLPVTWAEPVQPAAVAAREKKAVKRRKIPDSRQREMLLPTKGGKDASEGAAHQSVAASAATRRARQGR